MGSGHERDGAPNIRSGTTRRGFLTLGASAAAGVAFASVGTVAGGTGARASATQLRQRPEVFPGVREHIAAFQHFADAHGGSRPTGSPGLAASLDYVEDVLQRNGLETRRQPFPVQADIVRRMTLHRASPDPAELSPEPVYGCAATPVGGMRARLVQPDDHRGSSEQSWDGIATQGAIGLVDFVWREDQEPLRAQLRTARRVGLLGLVLHEPCSDLARSTRLTEDGDHGLPPAVLITTEDATDLRSMLEQGDTVLDLDVETELDFTATGTNLLARIAGSPPTAFLSGAHLDSAFEGPGINDNAASAAIVLSSATLQAQRGPCPIEFCWWDGEELGCLGSMHYVTQLQAGAGIGHLRGVLNMELPGSPNPTLAMLGTESRAHYEGYLREHGYPFRSVESRFAGTDILPFLLAGVPAASIGCEAGPLDAEEAEWYGGIAGELCDPNYHTANDRIESLRWDMVDLVGWTTDAAHRSMLDS